MTTERLTAEDTLFSVMQDNNFVYASFPAFVENESSVDVYDVCCKAMEALAVQEVAAELAEEKKSNKLLHEAMVTAEKRGHDKALEEVEARMPTEVLRMFFNELIQAGRDMNNRDYMGQSYLAEELYFKDFEVRFRSRMKGENK